MATKLDLPSPKKLQEAWEVLKSEHKKYLTMYDVKIPDVEKYDETQHSLWLAMLRINLDKGVHKSEMSKLAQRDKPELAADQQVRHLKRAGWNLIDVRRGMHKLDPYKPSPEWNREQTRRRQIDSAELFDDLKKAFGYRCASCGGEEAKPDARYGDGLIELQQGHMNPERPLQRGNLIPQCQFCSQTYKNDFTFDAKGRVRAIASVGPLRRASKTTQKKALEWLLKRNLK